MNKQKDYFYFYDQIIIDNIANTFVQKSPIHGYGLFASQIIPGGTTLCKLGG